jgi:hypothetical protein
MEQVDTDINPPENSQMTEEKTIVHLQMKNFTAATLTGLILTTGFGAFDPAHAKPDCDANPDAPICSGEPRPKPKPQPNPTPKPAPTPTNYPAAIAFILKNSTLIEQTIDKVWNNFGKGVAAQKIKDVLNGQKVGPGRIKDVVVNLRDITVKEVKPGPASNQISVRLVIPNNNEKFDVAVAVLPDPSFRVFHTITMNLTLTIDNSSEPIKVDRLNVEVTDADVRGANVLGSVIKALGDFFTGGSFSRGIESKINRDIPLLKQLGAAIKSEIDKLPIPK